MNQQRIKLSIAAILYACLSVLLSGCRTGSSAAQADIIASQSMSWQITELSNTVDRLNQRLAAIEKDCSEIKDSTQFIKKIMDKMAYEPQIQTDLTGDK
jgi:outer membrane murein-binding lipoprotein Lpp